MPKYAFEGHGVYDVDLTKLLADLHTMLAVRVRYGYGKKAAKTRKPDAIASIDCSGAVCYWLQRRGVPIQGGSQQLREWAIAERLKESTPETCFGKGVLYLFVLPVTPTRAIGHTGLILDGETMESHGGEHHNGVDRRDWKSLPWAHECRVFVLSRPK